MILMLLNPLNLCLLFKMLCSSCRPKKSDNTKKDDNLKNSSTDNWDDIISIYSSDYECVDFPEQEKMNM